MNSELYMSDVVLTQVAWTWWTGLVEMCQKAGQGALALAYAPPPEADWPEITERVKALSVALRLRSGLFWTERSGVQ